MSSPIHAVCFDVFGTLISFNGKRLNPYRHLVQSDLKTTAGRLAFLTRDAGIEVFAEELRLSHLMPMIRQELQEEQEGLSLFPEVDQALEVCRAGGLKVAVCSNLAKEYGQVARKLLPEMDAYVFSYEVGAVKPDPAIYSMVCEELGCSAQEVLFIGDSKRCDLHGPTAFGMKARWVDRRAGSTLLDALEEWGFRLVPSNGHAQKNHRP